MLQMWKLANAYARLIMLLSVVIPALFIRLVWIAEKEDKQKRKPQSA